MQPWTSQFVVGAYQADPSGHAYMQTLCDFLQEAAGHHADALGLSYADLVEQGLAWVLSRLHVEVDRYPRWGEPVVVRTWPSGHRGLLAFREYVIEDAEGTPFGRGSSAWLLFHLERRRPARLVAPVLQLEPPDLPPPLSEPFPDLGAWTADGEADVHRLPFRVRYSDLDLNGHVNNVRYVEWVAEAVPEPILRTQRLRSVEITYKAETTYGDTVHAETAPAEADTYRHRLVRASDGQAVALARTRWTSPDAE